MAFKLGVSEEETKKFYFEILMKEEPGERSRANPSLFQEGTRILTGISQPALCVPSHVEEERDSAGVCLTTQNCPAQACFSSELPNAKIKKL